MSYKLTPPPRARPRPPPETAVVPPVARQRLRLPRGPNVKKLEESAPRIYDPWDGPAPLAPVQGPDGKARQPQRSLSARVDVLAEMDREEAVNLLLGTLQEFLLAKTPVDLICERMNISINTYRTLREKLAKKLKDDISGKEPMEFLAPLLFEIDQVSATAWRDVATAPTAEYLRRLRALDVVMRAVSEKAKIYQLAGMFDGSPMRPALKQEDNDGGAGALKKMAEAFLTGAYSDAADRKSLLPGETIVDNV